MSADRWSICPKCKAIQCAKITAAINHAKQVAKNAYSKVPAEKYLKLHSAIAEAESIPEVGEETFREDFFVGTDADGQFTVDYHGECHSWECGFKVSFKHYEQKL